ncbi:MAG: TonB-dependent receptor [Parasphingorhabdus sp.]|uniref:TonB-dependent receptor n=1 Tax=Parasphingorhabdus sp. TaxID=2709688 RepID=UPI0030027B97
MKIIKRVHLNAASLAAITLAQFFTVSAQAQTADSDARSAGSDEIVVTATKRDEALEKVPIAVSVMTEAALNEQGISRASDFLDSTPNVTFIEDNAGEAYINIRGQTSVRNSDPNVAIVIDGVTLSSVKPFNQELFGLQQIEVLKGPQSALYGRNAAAGAIVVTTKKPDDYFEGQVVVARESFNTTRMSAGVSGPLTDTLGFTIAGAFKDTDGAFTNDLTGENVHRFQSTNGRARLVWEPTDRLSVDFKVGGHKSKGGGSAYNAQIAGSGIGGLPGGLDANFADMDFVSNIAGQFNESFVDVTLKADYEFDFATLTSISAYNRLNQYFGSDSPPYVSDTGAAGANYQQYTYLDKNYSQEVRLTSPSDGRFRWQVGFSYLRFDRNQTSNVGIDTLGTLPGNRNDIKDASSPFATLSYSNPIYRTTSYAPFASLQFDVTDRLHLNLAGRYDTEKRSVKEVASSAINPLTGASYNNCVALTGRDIDDCVNKRTFKQFEPKASLSYDIGEIGSIYASYGKGFKSGGFNPIGSRDTLRAAAIAANLNPDSVYVQDGYDKEVSTSYEAGLKTRLFDRALSFNIAAFQTDIKGAQQFEFYPTVGLQTTISVDEVRLRGFDLDFEWRSDFGMKIFGSYGYVDGEVKNFAGNPTFNGNVAPGSFKSTLSLGTAYELPISDEFTLTPRFEVNRYGTIWWDVANTPGTKRDPLYLVNGRLSLKSGDRWELSAYGNNLTNEKYFQEVVPLLGFFTVNYRGPTRSFGAEARVYF